MENMVLTQVSSTVAVLELLLVKYVATLSAFDSNRAFVPRTASRTVWVSQKVVSKKIHHA